MVLAIGLVVDDAIVVLENIHRHIEEGMPRLEAALMGAREIAFAVIAMTITLAAVYAPLAFQTGRTGRLFIEFALALAGAVLVSGFVALTLSPMMCSKLLRHEEKHGRFYNDDRALVPGADRRLPARARPRRCTTASCVIVGGARRGRRCRACSLCVLRSRARADRGPRRDLRLRERAGRRDRRATPSDNVKQLEAIYRELPETRALQRLRRLPHGAPTASPSRS